MKCLIIDTMHESLLPLLTVIGVQGDYCPEISPIEVLEKIAAYEGIIVRSKMNLDNHFFEAATALKFVARAGAGMDKIDVEAANRKGVVLLNAPEGNANALAEHALGMLLSILNHITTANTEVKHKLWRREANRGHELSAKCVGIIGYGHMGQAFARKLSLMGCKVVAYDKYKTNFADEYVEEVTLENLLVKANIVSVHVPLDGGNKHFINHAFFEKLTHSIWFVNTSRGEVVDTAALIHAIDSGKVRAAALDVLENEKLDTLTPQQYYDFEQLVKLPNVLLTPHVGGWTFESYQKINQVLVNKILQFKLSKS